MGQSSDLNTLTKKAESRERLKCMKKMKSRGIGFNYIEDFLRKSCEMGRVERIQGEEELRILREILGKKIKDERKNLKMIMEEDKREREKIEMKYGRKNRQYRMEVRNRNRWRHFYYWIMVEGVKNASRER